MPLLSQLLGPSLSLMLLGPAADMAARTLPARPTRRDLCNEKGVATILDTLRGRGLEAVRYLLHPCLFRCAAGDVNMLEGPSLSGESATHADEEGMDLCTEPPAPERHEVRGGAISPLLNKPAPSSLLATTSSGRSGQELSTLGVLGGISPLLISPEDEFRIRRRGAEDSDDRSPNPSRSRRRKGSEVLRDLNAGVGPSSLLPPLGSLGGRKKRGRN